MAARPSPFLLLILLILSILIAASAHSGSHSDSGSDSDADADSTPPPNLRSKSLILVKIWCLIIVFAGTFLGGVSPYFLKWNEGFLVLGTQFAGGVFLGTAMMHFLSDSDETFQDLTDKTYPFAFMLACAGYVVTMLADCVISGVVGKGRGVRDVEGGRDRGRGGKVGDCWLHSGNRPRKIREHLRESTQLQRQSFTWFGRYTYFHGRG